MHITATQIIAHYSVNFGLIRTPFENLALLLLYSGCRTFQGHSINGCASKHG